MSQGCDQFTSEILKKTLDFITYKVGDRCEAHMKSPCRDKEDKCEAREAMECMKELQGAVTYGRYFLPGSAVQMCM